MQELRQVTNTRTTTTPGYYTYTWEEMLKDLGTFLKTLSVGALESGRFFLQLPVLTVKLTSIQQRSVASDFAEIYDKTPNLLVKGLQKELTVTVKKLAASGESVESILRKYMQMAQIPSNLPIAFSDGIPGTLKILDFIGKFLHWKGDLVDLYEDNTVIPFPLRPSLLAMLWGVMLADLAVPAIRYSDSESTMGCIARLSIALTLGILTGATGYFHAGGSVAGVRSPTAAIGTYYNAQHLIKDNAPSAYYKIPSCLLMPSTPSFDSLRSSEKISAAQGLNMAYTFRIGDTFLRTMEGHSFASDSLFADVMRNIWPLVSEYEAKRMYELYIKNEKMYFL